MQNFLFLLPLVVLISFLLILPFPLHCWVHKCVLLVSVTGFPLVVFLCLEQWLAAVMGKTETNSESYMGKSCNGLPLLEHLPVLIDSYREEMPMLLPIICIYWVMCVCVCGCIYGASIQTQDSYMLHKSSASKLLPQPCVYS